MTLETSTIPNCETLSKNIDKINLIKDFMEFLTDTEGFVLATWGENQFRPDAANVNTHELILKYFGIDPVELEKERVKLIDSIHSKTE